MAAKTTSEMLASAESAVADLPMLSMKARASARTAIELLQDHVMSSLGDAKLIGQPNIGTSNDRFNGVNVRADDKTRKVKNGKPTLAIDRDGSLVIVCFTPSEIIVEPFDMRRATMRDLGDVIESYRMALSMHMEAAKRANENYREVGRLAGRIRDALHGSEETEKEGKS